MIGSKKKILLFHRLGSKLPAGLEGFKTFELNFFKDIIDAVYDSFL
jgi:hypothetical protein